jgi:thiol-disulfide isomerase/thioredoxin
MNSDSKKQLMALFIVSMFVISGVAFAVISAIAPEQSPEQKYVVNTPLSNSEEAYYLQRNIVVVRYYYSPDCVDCQSVEPMVDSIASHFASQVLVETIDVDQYANETEGFTPPTIYLKGKSTKEITSNFSVNSIFLDICEMFFNTVNACSI